jgi:hypothetical protein
LAFWLFLTGINDTGENFWAFWLFLTGVNDTGKKNEKFLDKIFLQI